MQFWIGWELWQKMCFVLGGLIVIVLIYSFCVLAHNRRMLKKYAAAEAFQKAERQRNLDLEETRKNDIPFGARALESGIQIEGIWISNHNTPLPSPRQPATPSGSRPPSPTLRPTSQPPTAAVMAQTEKRPVTCSTLPPLNNSHSRRHSRASSAVVVDDHYGSESFALEKQCSRQRTYSESEKQAHTAPLRGSTLQPHRHSESGARNPEMLVLLENYRQRPGAGDSRGRSSSSDEFGAFANRIINEHMSMYSSEIIQLRPFEGRAFNEDRRSDLDSMHNHRRSHVAETGQLGSARSSGANFRSNQRAHLNELGEKLNAVEHQR